MPPLLLSVPLELPTPERVEAIIREAALEVAKEQVAWLSFRQAAKHLGISMRTFERKKKALGIPVSEVDGVKRIARQDLDALMRKHLNVPETTVINFPSVEQRNKERQPPSVTQFPVPQQTSARAGG